MAPKLVFLDGGFSAGTIGTKADEMLDFLDPNSIAHLQARFDLVFCFDTLEHVSNPFLFCQHLISITRPGGHVFVSTVFRWHYHPAPEDYFRFSPAGLREVFRNSANSMSQEFSIIWVGWGHDRRGVALLGQRLDAAQRGKRHSVHSWPPIDQLLVSDASDQAEQGRKETTGGILRRWIRTLPLSKARAFGRQFRRVSSKFLVYPVRLPWGVWMVAWPDVMGRNLRRGRFEENESKFVERFLQPGMVMFDVGAHNGFYSLLAARRVGKRGQVVAFEPSARERRRFRWNIGLNRLNNILIVPSALGDYCGSTDYFVVLGQETGCNSMRPPAVNDRIERTTVPITTVDEYLSRSEISAVDLIKLDIEGAELAFLKGGGRLLTTQPRPVFLCELADIRSGPFGHKAEEIRQYLIQFHYLWFTVTREGDLCPSTKRAHHNENQVAVPEERLPELVSFLSTEVQGSKHESI